MTPRNKTCLSFRYEYLGEIESIIETAYVHQGPIRVRLARLEREGQKSRDTVLLTGSNHHDTTVQVDNMYCTHTVLIRISNIC